MRELQSIVDYGRFSPAMDPVFGAVSSFYWSSSSYAGHPVSAWGVHFNDGYVGIDDKDMVSYVRAVRRRP